MGRALVGTVRNGNAGLPVAYRYRIPLLRFRQWRRPKSGLLDFHMMEHLSAPCTSHACDAVCPFLLSASPIDTSYALFPFFLLSVLRIPASAFSGNAFALYLSCLLLTPSAVNNFRIATSPLSSYWFPEFAFLIRSFSISCKPPLRNMLSLIDRDARILNTIY